ncbi:MAG: V4R domain-containing protein [Candidatus Aenigmatarchaeota archaeon]
MAINLENFFRKLLFARQLKIREGYLEIFDTPYVLFPAESFSSLIDDIIKTGGKKGKINIYKEGIKIGKNIAKVIKRTTGAKGDELMDAIFKVGGMGGWGLWKIYRKNDSKKEGIVHASNIATANFKFHSKKRNEPSCHLLRGIMTGELREIWNSSNIEAIETRCISQGHKFCEFIAKRRKDFDKKNKFVKNQLEI